MATYWRLVNEVIRRSEIVLEVLDGRMIEKTRNAELEDKIAKAQKKLIYVLTKCDLCSKEEMESAKHTLNPSVFVSAPKRYGIMMLRDKILQYATTDPVIVGVVGYPNVGKSSLINALAGRHSAPTSPVSGYTRGIQLIKVDNRIRILDTPGVIPYMEKDKEKHAMTATVDWAKVKDPESAVFSLMVEYPGMIEKKFRVKIGENKEETLEKIALKSGCLVKGGEPDCQRMARVILRQWQLGEIGKGDAI